MSKTLADLIGHQWPENPEIREAAGQEKHQWLMKNVTGLPTHWITRHEYTYDEVRKFICAEPLGIVVV